MIDPSPQLHELILQLGQLEFLARVQEQQLAQTQRWIVAKQAAIEQQKHRDARAAQPPPEWIIQHGIGAGPPTIHTTLSEDAAQCWARVGRERCAPTTREQAMTALTQENADPCQICRPDTVLGVLDA